jgi:transcriptional regulator with XRE-family HTH domain
MDNEKQPERTSFFESFGFKSVSVGRRLRLLRREKGYSIKALAEESGLAVNTLSLIENEKSSPSVSTLEQLAKTLGIPLTAFFEPLGSNKRLIHTKAGERDTKLLNGIHVEDCGIELEGNPLQPFVVTLNPGESSGTDLIEHPGYEFIFCLSGELTYIVDGKKYLIKKGDSLFFFAEKQHQWKNSSQSPAEYLLILIPEENPSTLGKIHFDL